MGHEFEDLSKGSYESFLGASVSAFHSQVPVDICFESVKVGHSRLDLVVANQLILELKAVDALHDIHFAQLRSYLRATGLRLGLLLNFNAPTLAIRRIVLD